MTQNHREVAIHKLTNIIQNDKKSKNIEISIYNWTINYMKQNKIIPVLPTKKNKKIYDNSLTWENSRFVKVYLNKCRSIIFNLKNTNNPDFLCKIKNGEIKSKDVSNLKPEEMYPDLWIPVFKKINDKEKRSLRNEGLLLENAVETNYQCSKCKCRKIDHYGVQTRSADEPMTLYFTCLNCYNRWKE